MEGHLRLRLASTISLLLLLLLSSTATPATAGRPGSVTAVEFIRTSCTKTTFPGLCFSSLSSYASEIQTSPKQLANKALSVSLAVAESTSATMSKMCQTTRGMRPREAQAMKDCVENVGYSVDELRQSMSEMKQLGGQDLWFHMSNIQTWVSAALTDADTCMDGFAGKSMNGALKTKVRGQIKHLAKLTSNALALVNNLVN